MSDPNIIASFRGIPFRTTDAGLGVGRRNVLNEYPLRDTPYVDDLGRRARKYNVKGYLLGDDYLQQRDALQDAFEEPGPGELVHPRYGVVWVSLLGEAQFDESHREGRLSRFSATFVEDADNTQPSGETDTAAEVARAADICDDMAGAAFADALSLSGPQILTDLVANATLLDIGALTSAASLYVESSGLGDLLNAAGSVIGQVTTLLQAPLALVTSLRGLYVTFAAGIRPAGTGGFGGGDGSGAGGYSGAMNAMQTVNLRAAADLPVLNAARAAAAASPLAPATTSRTLLNQAAQVELTRRLAITTQARILAIAITDEAVPTADQATAARDQVVTQIDAELERADPDAHTARALSTLRAAVVRDVATRAERLRQRAAFTPLAVLPALVLAHRVYQDASRADELVQRNGVRHPGFVPARALEILR